MTGRCIVVAYNAPVNQGVATADDGQLGGDPEILDRARSVKEVIVALPGPPETMDWENPLHVTEALRQGAIEAYGEPIEVFMPQSQATADAPSDDPADVVY